MYNYIIYWVLVSLQSAPCPDAGKRNEFGMLPNPYMSCAVMHYRTDKVSYSKEFKNRDSAQAFYSRLKAYKPSGFSFSEDKIERLSIDSLKIK